MLSACAFAAVGRVSHGFCLMAPIAHSSEGEVWACISPSAFAFLLVQKESFGLSEELWVKIFTTKLSGGGGGAGWRAWGVS